MQARLTENALSETTKMAIPLPVSSFFSATSLYQVTFWKLDSRMTILVCNTYFLF